MKKSTSPTGGSEPMGIVITAGVRAPVEPLVRAYVWGQWSDDPDGYQPGVAKQRSP